MSQESEIRDVTESLRNINQAWLRGEIETMAPFLHPDIVMALPGFSGRLRGRDLFLSGFKEFVSTARILEYQEHDEHVDIVGPTATITFRYRMRYERDGTRFNAAGRDLWVLHKRGAEWLAVWRTMLDLSEAPAEEAE